MRRKERKNGIKYTWKRDVKGEEVRDVHKIKEEKQMLKEWKKYRNEFWKKGRGSKKAKTGKGQVA